MCGGIDDVFSDGINMDLMSKRAIDFLDFSGKVVKHIDEYTVPQYGDKPDDNVESWSADDCFKQVEKYLKRRSSSKRPGEKRLDVIKMAHYLQLGFDKMGID